MVLARAAAAVAHPATASAPRPSDQLASIRRSALVYLVASLRRSREPADLEEAAVLQVESC
jgi:hypothetical protein